jgi:hypothetical protein
MSWTQTVESKYSFIILHLGIEWRWVASFTPLPLFSQENRPLYPLDRRLIWSDKWINCGITNGSIPRKRHTLLSPRKRIQKKRISIHIPSGIRTRGPSLWGPRPYRATNTVGAIKRDEELSERRRAFKFRYEDIVSRDSAVGITTTYGLDDRSVGVRVPVEARIFSSPRRSYRLWGPPSLLSKGNRTLFLRG